MAQTYINYVHIAICGGYIAGCIAVICYPIFAIFEEAAATK